MVFVQSEKKKSKIKGTGRGREMVLSSPGVTLVIVQAASGLTRSHAHLSSLSRRTELPASGCPFPARFISIGQVYCSRNARPCLWSQYYMRGEYGSRYYSIDRIRPRQLLRITDCLLLLFFWFSFYLRETCDASMASIITLETSHIAACYSFEDTQH